jgi:dienelactone hydrolase
MSSALLAIAGEFAGGTASVVPVPTANPVNFHEAINAPDRCERLDIDALVVLPDGPGPHPVVIVLPGSSGVAANHVMHARTLFGRGYGVCLVDPFSARSVTSTVANQAQFSFAASAYDVLAAMAVLAADERVDARRITAQGHSRGGAAVIMAAMRPFAQPIVGNLALAGAYAAYPWCGQQFARPAVGSTVVRAIIGQRDDWCSVVAVQMQIQSILLSGGSASMRIVPDAHHSFDRHEDVHELAEARVSPNAPIEFLDGDGAMTDPVTGASNPDRTDVDQFRAAVAAGFGQRGAHLGSTGDQPQVFMDDMLAFHAEVLGTP